MWLQVCNDQHNSARASDEPSGGSQEQGVIRGVLKSTQQVHQGGPYFQGGPGWRERADHHQRHGGAAPGHLCGAHEARVQGMHPQALPQKAAELQK